MNSILLISPPLLPSFRPLCGEAVFNKKCLQCGKEFDAVKFSSPMRGSCFQFGAWRITARIDYLTVFVPYAGKLFSICCRLLGYIRGPCYNVFVPYAGKLFSMGTLLLMITAIVSECFRPLCGEAVFNHYWL